MITSFPVNEEQPIVFVIDDDASVRESLTDLLHSVGLRAEAFGCTEEFLQHAHPDVPGCIVLDVRLPGPSGLEFQRTLLNSDLRLPIIFISAHGDIPMSVRAMKLGAIAFLTKPLHPQDLLDAVQEGIKRDRAMRQDAKVIAALQERLAALTHRERELFALVITGQRNKQIADQANLSEMTVKVHRSQIMRKMGAKTLVDLVRIADKLGISAKKSDPI